MRLIDADELKEFFFSEYSGTEDIINDLMSKYGLTYENDINEETVNDFAMELLSMVCNVIDTAETIEVNECSNKNAEILYKMFDTVPCDIIDYDELIDEWCDKNCVNEDPVECWKHFLEGKWYEKENEIS